MRVTLRDGTPIATITLIDPRPEVVVADEDALRFASAAVARGPRTGVPAGGPPGRENDERHPPRESELPF
ncbi:hypothetical protein [Streptomyces sp. CNQ085]|uniref:hypothetical protein n=1 Tax=Streptomyces sp. CNQ085 TaxID=2886944 RepID=UPI001F51442F|nr:hypothetical protein [Streptomyces sp. CNQ085]MCI0382891.1 hypothetical protein [Streptomyces sp. CNQ085]